MASIDCDQKHLELARTTQHIIEHILEINREIEGLYAPMKSVFSSFTVLSDIVAYEASIRVAIKDLTLAHFELVFPTYPVAEVEAQPETTPPNPSWFGIPPISLLFNISITQIPLPPERTPLVFEKTRSKRRLTPEAPERTQKAKAEAAREPTATLFSHIALLQSGLATTVASRLETASFAFLESQKQLLKREGLAPSSESVVLGKTEFEEISTERIPVSLEIPQIEAVQATKSEMPIRTTEQGEGDEAKIIESPQKALLRWAATIQRELIARTAPALEFESLLLQTQKQALRLASTASESRVSPLEKTRFEEIATAQIEIPRDIYKIEATKIARPSLHKGLSKEEEKGRIIEEQVGETRNETLLQWIISVQRQLIARLAPQLRIESAALEPQKKTILELPVVLKTKTAFPEDFHGDETQTRRISVPEEKTAMVTARIKAAPELPWLIAYVKGLPTLMLETQKSFATALYSSEASTDYRGPLVDLTAESQISQSQPAVLSPVPSNIPLPAYWVRSVLLPMLESMRALSAFPVATLTTQRFYAETVTEKTSAMEMPSENGVDVAPAKRTAAPSNLEAEERYIEAIRLPTILAQLLNGYLRKSPTNYPTFQEQLLGETSLEEESSLGKMGKKQVGAQPVSAKKPMNRIFSLLQEAPEERTKYGPAAFIEELQLANAIYGRELSELAVSGPVRATMLSELSSGILVPLLQESNLLTELPAPELIKSNFPEKSSASERLRSAFPEEESININVFEGTAEEDLRELERKIERILSEQLFESGTLGSLRTTLPREPSFESGETLGSLDSQTISSALLRRSNAVEGDIMLNKVTETADEDAKELEKKIRKILSAQISRYYGSINP